MNKYTFYHSEEEDLVAENDEPLSEEELLLSDEEWTAEKDESSGSNEEWTPSPARKRARGASASSARGGRVRGRGSQGGKGRPTNTSGSPQGRGSGTGNAELEGVASTSTTENPPPTKSYDDPDVKNTLPPFEPRRDPGLHFDRTVFRGELTTELEFFKLFFTHEIVSSVATHTNSYAFKKTSEGGYTTYTNSDGTWDKTTINELYRLVAILVYFGLVNIDNNIEKYWSTKTLYHGLWARKILSRTRFKALMAFLHVVAPDQETPGDKLRKVEQFVSSFKERCHLLYQPRQNIAVDERMVKSKHRSGIRQYMKDKPTKWGLKLWVLVDSSNGYTVDFDIYIGKKTQGETSDEGLGYDVVMKLVKPYLNQGYHVFFDNFYTSHRLVTDLFLSGTPSSGTVRINRVGFPKTLSDVKVWARRKERGTMRWERESNVLTVQWIDSKPVSLLTTIDSANDKVEVKRRTKKKGEFQELSVPQPLAIHRYNQYMNGVDRSDQMLACHNVSRKCYRWWKTLFFHLIDIAIVNGFLLFSEHRADCDDEALERSRGYSIVDFREALVRQICEFDEYGDPPANENIQPVQDYETVHMPEVSDAWRKNCVVCYASGRGEKKVSTYCTAPQCGKFMHVGGGWNCFKEWHSRDYAGKR